jgi:hypothetical protein
VIRHIHSFQRQVRRAARLVISLLSALRFINPPTPLFAASTRYVAPSGTDAGNCLNSARPCKTFTSVISQVVANSTARGNCSGPTPVTTQGHNLDSGNTCGLNPAMKDQSNVDPKLKSLASNGGFTQTHALSEKRPAVDKGTNRGGPSTDQRGVARPRAGNGDGTATCDIGAYEYGKEKSYEKLNHSCVLRRADILRSRVRRDQSAESIDQQR